jgi:hypothetical protein
MSSTDPVELRRFYREQLVRVARELLARGVRSFPLGPEPQQPTWYRAVPPGEPELIEFEAETAEAQLRDHWQREGLPELARLAPALLALARALEPSAEQSAEVSPFVYVMY